MAFIQTDTFTIRGYECDAFGRMSVLALMNMMQESANRNALAYGIGITDLAKRGFGWMLMRFRLHMHQYPRYGQTIKVVTYPTIVEKYFIYRDFQVLADDGTLLANAASTWLVFSIEKRTMVPLPDFIRALSPPSTVIPLPKLSSKPDFSMSPFVPDAIRDVEVSWFSIDQNQHVNNVAYVGWLLEAADRNTLQTQELAEIDLVYRAESHWGEQLQVQSIVETPQSFRHRIIQYETSKEVLLARSQWRTYMEKTISNENDYLSAAQEK